MPTPRDQRRHRLIGSVMAACLLAAAPPQDPTRLRFDVRRVDEPPILVQWVGLDRNWKLRFDNGDPLELAGADVVSIDRVDDRTIAGPRGSQIWLANGDRLRGTVTRATQESLELQTELLGMVAIPLERVQLMLLDGSRDARGSESFSQRLNRDTRGKDRVHLANGDQVGGTLLEISDTSVRIEVGKSAVALRRPAVPLVTMNSELTSFPRPRQLHARLVLSDGSIVTLLDAELRESTLHGRTSAGPDLAISLAHIASLTMLNGRVTYLSDLTPALVRHTPFFGLQFGWQRDRSVSENPISLDGRPYRKGLGVHSQSVLTYALDGTFRRFDATIGIDDETKGRGSVVFRVLLDGTIAFESPELLGGSAAVPIRVPLANAKRLELLVDFASNGDVQDHADWGDARLVR